MRNFITIEGCDGVGKSTQVRLLRERLSKEGVDAVFKREHGGADIAETIRAVILDADNSDMDALTELFLFVFETVFLCVVLAVLELPL